MMNIQKIQKINKIIVWFLVLPIVYAKYSCANDDAFISTYKLPTNIELNSALSIKNSSVFEFKEQLTAMRDGYLYFASSESAFAPYLSADINYAQVKGIESCSDLANIEYCALAQENYGVSMLAQIGFNYFLDKNWHLNVEAKLPISSAKFSLLDDYPANQTNSNNLLENDAGNLNGKLDTSPWILGIGIGYKF